jgi:hypothetical protein
MFVTDFWECVIPEALVQEITETRNALKKAEEALLEWGLSVTPPDTAAVLRKGLSIAVYRTNILRLFLDLNPIGGQQ